jgi:hypothetical protein
MAELIVERGRDAIERALMMLQGESGATGSGGAGLVRRSPRSAEEMLSAERAHAEAGRELGDRLIATDILLAHLDAELVRCAAREARLRLLGRGAIRHIKDVGLRPVEVRLPGGSTLRMHTMYLRPTRKGLPGRPRGTGKRGENGAGLYPVLEWLGVMDHVTPSCREKICRQAVLCGSYAEAQDQLRRDGLSLDIKTLFDIGVRTGQKALSLRDEALARARQEPLPVESLAAGRRIRVSIDGGRVRIRQTYFERRKRKNGRRAFKLAWQEPRIVTIDALDAEGKADNTNWRPIYEVSFGDAGQVFELVVGLLRHIGANQASQVVFVSDGAAWIWARVGQLIEQAELRPESVRLVLDYYHATEYVAEALNVCKSMPPDERAALREKLCGLLLEPDGVKQVIAQLTLLARGRRSPDIKKAIRYIESHLEHADYAALRAQHVPIGSGVVESAVRRVINLRFKASTQCWREDRVQPLMYLRAVLKAGWWDELLTGVLSQRHWLPSVRASNHATAAAMPELLNYPSDAALPAPALGDEAAVA